MPTKQEIVDEIKAIDPSTTANKDMKTTELVAMLEEAKAKTDGGATGDQGAQAGQGTTPENGDGASGTANAAGDAKPEEKKEGKKKGSEKPFLKSGIWREGEHFPAGSEVSEDLLSHLKKQGLEGEVEYR